MNTTFIYILIDPITNQVRYVGKTNHPKRRFLDHQQPTNNKNSHKRNWINKLKKLGHKPNIEIIDEVSLDNWRYWESFYIAYFKMIGCKLTNHTEGGDGTSMHNKGTFKKGQKPWNVGITHTNETKAKISDISKQQRNKGLSKMIKRKCRITGTLEIFPSIKEAVRQTNISYRAIYRRINNECKSQINEQFYWSYC